MEGELIRQAFSRDLALCERVIQAANENRGQLNLLLDVARYITGRSTTHHPPINGDGPQSKKRKLDEPVHPTTTATTSAGSWQTQKPFCVVTDVSFSVPQRKKYTVEFVGDGNAGGLRVTDPKTSKVEYGVDWTDIDQVFCLPVPEKTQRQQNFVIFLKDGPPSGNSWGDPVPDQIVFTVPETPPKTLQSQEVAVQEEDTYVSCIARCFDSRLQAWGNTIQLPDEREFASAIPQSHRKGEKAYHVKAHRGSKDGYLFFLSCGIVWAFKKPLGLYTFDLIESISYTSVLQRTFNLVVTITPNAPDQAKQDIEFSMLDQADYAGIDDYVKRHNLNDASMAAERRAKKLNVNAPKVKGEPGANGHVENGDEEEEETELQKAERELQDAEDEEEEDYDPGSEGESEGEGSETGEEDEGGYDDENGEEMEEEDDDDVGEEE